MVDGLGVVSVHLADPCVPGFQIGSAAHAEHYPKKFWDIHNLYYICNVNKNNNHYDSIN